METRNYIATIECDGVVTEALPLAVTISGKNGQGQIDVPASLVGVAMNASSAATVTTEEGATFRILFTTIHMPEAVADFVVEGALPEVRKRA